MSQFSNIVLSNKEWTLFSEHMKRFPNQTPCPVCGGKDWKVAGPTGLPGMAFTGSALVCALPVIPVCCGTCGFVRMFAWRAVTKPENEHEQADR